MHDALSFLDIMPSSTPPSATATIPGMKSVFMSHSFGKCLQEEPRPCLEPKSTVLGQALNPGRTFLHGIRIHRKVNAVIAVAPETTSRVFGQALELAFFRHFYDNMAFILLYDNMAFIFRGTGSAEWECP